MAFDMGFDCRNTVGYVTDPAYGVFVNETHAYPHTYTNGNGDSINAGWTTAPVASVDRSNTVDVRLAGVCQNNSGVVAVFQTDLSSGSNPGAGDYTVDLAVGDAVTARTYTTVLVKDNTTTLISFGGTTGGANQYFDATGTNRSPGSGAWNGVTSAQTFASTTAILSMTATFDTTDLAHFRLTLAGGAAAVTYPQLERFGSRGIERGILTGVR